MSIISLSIEYLEIQGAGVLLSDSTIGDRFNAVCSKLQPLHALFLALAYIKKHSFQFYIMYNENRKKEMETHKFLTQQLRQNQPQQSIRNGC